MGQASACRALARSRLCGGVFLMSTEIGQKFCVFLYNIADVLTDRPELAIYYILSAGTICVRAACQPGAKPARTPTIAEMARLTAATGSEGRKAMVTASAPTES